MAKYIEFENDGETLYGKPEYLVKSKSGGNVLARIVWYPRWRQWVCEPAPNTIWSQDCLADMREYMRDPKAKEAAVIESAVNKRLLQDMPQTVAAPMPTLNTLAGCGTQAAPPDQPELRRR